MAAWQKPEYLMECLPNRVFRFRKQAQSKYHKVIITDEANLSTLLPTCYKSMTLLFVDNMNKNQLEQEIRELLSHIHKRCKSQKVVFLYTCGLSTLLSRYSLANTSKGTNCCSKCDLYLFNNLDENLFMIMTSLRDLISSSLTMCYFLPTALPPFSIKWHVTQFQAEHQQCCSHAMHVLSASDISKSVRDEMQASLDEKLAQYNQLVNADCREKNLPVIDWSKTYLTNTNLSEREKNIMMKVTSLLCDFISVIYQDECSQELQQIQNALSASDDEIQVKEEPSDPQEESSSTQSLNKDVSTKSECEEEYSKHSSSPRRSPRKLSSLKLSNQHTSDVSSSLANTKISMHDSAGYSIKRKMELEEHNDSRNKRICISSEILPASVTNTDASHESRLENKAQCQYTSTSNEMESVEQELSTMASETETACATKSNMTPSTSSCLGAAVVSPNDIICSEMMEMNSAVPTDDETRPINDVEEGRISEGYASSQVPSKNYGGQTAAPEESGSQEVLVINPSEEREVNTVSPVPCTIRRADSSSDIQILENTAAPSSSDVICLSNQSLIKFKGQISKISSSMKKKNGNGVGRITSTSKRFPQSVVNKSIDSTNDVLVVLEQNASHRKAEQRNLKQNATQNITNRKSTKINEVPVLSCSIELDHSPPSNSVFMDNSKETGCTKIACDLTENVLQNIDKSCMASSTNEDNKVGKEINKSRISEEDDDVGCITSNDSNQCSPKKNIIINEQLQPTLPSTVYLRSCEATDHPIVRNKSLTDQPVIQNLELDSSESNARNVLRVPSITELPLTVKIEQDSFEDVKPVLEGNCSTAGDFASPAYWAIRQSPIPKRDRRQRNSSISSTSTEGSVQQPEFVESDVSVFKRTDAIGDALHILITDERLEAVTELLVNDASYSNCMHICGHDTTIPQMNNGIREALVETRKLKMNQSKILIVAVCLGTVDIINLLGTMKSLPASGRKPKKVKYTTPEVVTLVFNRLVLLKRSIKELDDNARVILFKLPPTQVGGHVKVAIDQVNSLIHRCNRDDKTVSSGTRYPLRKLCKVSEPAYTLSNESTAHWLETCKFVISLVEKAIQEEKEAAATLRLDEERKQKCVIDLEPSLTSSRKRRLFNKERESAKRVSMTAEIENLEPEFVEERSGKKVPKTGSHDAFEPEVVGEGNGKNALRTDSSGNFELEVVGEGSGEKVSIAGPGNVEPEVVDVEEDRCKKSVGSDASGKRPKTTKRRVNEIFINKHDNIVCVTPGSVKAVPCRSSPRTPYVTVPDKPSSSSTTSSGIAPAPQYLPDDDSISKQINAYMRLLLRKEGQDQHDDVLSGISSQLSSNVCALLALSRVAFSSSTVDNEALLAAARRLHVHEQSANNRGSPNLEHVQKKAIIEAVGEAVQYLEDAVIGQEASDVLYAAVLNVKKVYAA